MRAAGESVRIVHRLPSATSGSAGLRTQLGSQPATVSGIALATGGIHSGSLMEAALG